MAADQMSLGIDGRMKVNEQDLRERMEHIEDELDSAFGTELERVKNLDEYSRLQRQLDFLMSQENCNHGPVGWHERRPALHQVRIRAGGVMTSPTLCRGCKREAFPGLLWCADCLMKRFFPQSQEHDVPRLFTKTQERTGSQRS